MKPSGPQLLLRIPPFPGAKCREFGVAHHAPVAHEDAAECIELMRMHRVGGSFWGARPDIPGEMQCLLIPRDTKQASEMIIAATTRNDARRIAILMADDAPLSGPEIASFLKFDTVCDPWHLFDHFEEIWADACGKISHLLGRRQVFWRWRCGGAHWHPSGRPVAHQRLR
jgi:hypothetical protein